MTSTEGPEGAATTPRKVVVVAGSGRSGTSSIAGVLKLVGLRVPPPEVPGNRSNPRGFFEPRWVVDTQTRLLRRALVALTDSRPKAFDMTREVADDPEVRATVGEWLRDQADQHPSLVVKDPRTSWFLPMWRQAAADADAEVCFLTMLRHPAEVVGSKDAYYKTRNAGETVRHAQTTRVASWLNVALFTEATTRDARRTFVLYNDLLDDWRAVVARVGEELGLAEAQAVSEEAAAEVDEFVDPGLRRIRTEWSEIDCPDDVREMAEETWDHLCTLAASGGFDDAVEGRLDALRERYTQRYADAEALAQSSAEAAQRQGVQQGRRKALKEQRKAARAARHQAAVPRAATAPTGLAGRAQRVARRVARRVRRG